MPLTERMHSAQTDTENIGGRLASLRQNYLTRKEQRRRGKKELKRLRHSDCVLFSQGNSGRTWLRAMVTKVLEQKLSLEPGPLIDFDNLHKRDTRAPRIAVTHNRWLPYLRPPISGNECRQYYGSRVLILVRNPLDTCVSQYFQWLHRSVETTIALKAWPPRSSGLSLLDFLEHETTGVERLCGELNLWRRESIKFRDALFIRYEDLLEDTTAYLGQALAFLRIDASTEVVQNAVDFCAFRNMRKREVRQDSALNTTTRHSQPDEIHLKTRRGGAGGYREYFPSDTCNRLEKLVNAKLDPAFGYSDLPKILPLQRD